MAENKTIRPRVLSTRPLSEEALQKASARGVDITILPFIDTEPIQTTEVLEEIENALQLSATVVFTSMNAVEAIAGVLEGRVPDWQVYCMGNTTRELVEIFLGEESIAGTADSAVALADRIIEDAMAEEVIFFCGDQRRDELPDMLFAAGIIVTEIVVYETIATPHQLNETFDGVLFYSPSAVDSFFSANRLLPQSIVFAIGQTTAAAVKKHCSNRIIIADKPGKEALALKAVELFSNKS